VLYCNRKIITDIDVAQLHTNVLSDHDTPKLWSWLHLNANRLKEKDAC